MTEETPTCRECQLCCACISATVCTYDGHTIDPAAECSLPPPMCWKECLCWCLVNGCDPRPGKPCPCNPKRVRRLIEQIGGGPDD